MPAQGTCTHRGSLVYAAHQLHYVPLRGDRPCPKCAEEAERGRPFSPAQARRLAEEITLRRTAECLGDLQLRRTSVARQLLIAAHTRGTPLYRHLNATPVRATTHEHLVLLHTAARNSLEGQL